MLRHVFNALAIVVLTLFWSLVALVVVPINRKGRAVCVISRIWARSVLGACGVTVQADGIDGPFDAPAYLVMANHSSHFDVIAIFGTLPLDMRPVAKRELAYIPIFGWVLAAGAAIMIDRGDREKAIASIERAGRTIREGRSVLMFPEGTRTPPGTLGRMKKGPFHLAVTAGVPVLPIGLTGTGAVLLPHDWRIRPGHVRLRVGLPIETAGLPEGEAGRDLLSARVASALKALM